MYAISAKHFFSLLHASVFWCLAATAQPAYVIRHVNVVDMRAGTIQHDMSVLISGNKIEAVSKEFKKPKGATVIDASGKYLMPGLCDMHAHVGFDDTFFFWMNMVNGVTALRDMGTRFRTNRIGLWRDSVNNAAGYAPRLLGVAGRKINGLGGFEGYGFDLVTSEDEARAAVRERHRTGATFIKAYEHLTPACYRALLQEAREMQLPVAGHPPLAIGFEEFVAGGQKTVEHINRLNIYCSRQEPYIVKTYADSLPSISLPINARTFHGFRLQDTAYATFDTLKANHVAITLAQARIAVCPTLVLDQSFSFDRKPDDERKRILDGLGMPSALQKKLAPPIFFESLKGDSVEAQAFQRLLYLVKLLHQKGVMIIAGTDAPSMDFYSVYHGYSLHEELRLYVEAGLTPFQALKTATVNPAEFFNRGHELGTVETGKLADLILLDANPLQNITNTRAIHAVIMNGRYWSRKELDELTKRMIERVHE